MQYCSNIACNIASAKSSMTSSIQLERSPFRQNEHRKSARLHYCRQMREYSRNIACKIGCNIAAILHAILQVQNRSMTSSIQLERSPFRQNEHKKSAKLHYCV